MGFVVPLGSRTFLSCLVSSVDEADLASFTPREEVL